MTPAEIQAVVEEARRIKRFYDNSEGQTLTKREQCERDLTEALLAIAERCDQARVIIEAIPDDDDLDRAQGRKVYRDDVPGLFTADDDGFSALYLPDAAKRWLSAIDARKEQP